MNVDDIFYHTLVMNIASGLLAGQTDDNRYHDIPDKKKEEVLAEQSIKYANAIIKKLSERLEKTDQDHTEQP